jgi:hypothetical protein
VEHSNCHSCAWQQWMVWLDTCWCCLQPHNAVTPGPVAAPPFYRLLADCHIAIYWHLCSIIAGMHTRTKKPEGGWQSCCSRQMLWLIHLFHRMLPDRHIVMSLLHRRRYAHTYKEARAWLAELLQQADACSPSRPLVVGVDTETAVKWGQRQADTPTSLLQLCYHARGSAKVRGAGQMLSRLGFVTGCVFWWRQCLCVEGRVTLGAERGEVGHPVV